MERALQPAFSMLAEAHCPSYLVPPKICRFCKTSRLSFDFLKFFFALSLSAKQLKRIGNKFNIYQRRPLCSHTHTHALVGGEPLPAAYIVRADTRAKG